MSPTNTISTSTTDTQTNNDNADQHKSPHINISPQSASRQPLPKPAQRPQRPVNNHNAASFIGDLTEKPRDDERHSKVPYFLRLSGSITPRMLVPLTFVAVWATAITCISQFVYPLVVNSLLLTVLGFVVGLGISFRTSSAYERYIEGYVFSELFFLLQEFSESNKTCFGSCLLARHVLYSTFTREWKC